MNRQFLILSLFLLTSAKSAIGASFREESLKQLENDYKEKVGIPEERKLHISDLIMNPNLELDPEPVEKVSPFTAWLRTCGMNLVLSYVAFKEWIAMWAQIIKVRFSTLFSSPK